TVEDMFAEGDQVVTKKTFHVTHEDEFFGIPATGAPVTLTFVDIMRVRDGRITEHWLCMDQLSFMQQLGVIPTPEYPPRGPHRRQASRYPPTVALGIRGAWPAAQACATRCRG